MLNSKQRAKLRSLATNISASTIIGKDGLTENVLNQIKNELFSRELVKISVLEGSEKPASELLKETAEKLGAEEVCVIGRKFVLYKRSNKNKIKHIEF